MSEAKGASQPQEKVFGSGPVRYTLPQGFNGPIKINIDFSLAAPPSIYYYADLLSLDYDVPLAMVKLLFGRRGGEDANVGIVLPEMVMFGHFWNSTRGVEEAVDQQLQLLGRRPISGADAELSAPAQTFYANAVFASLGMGESCLDFYYLPPRDLHLARTRGADMELFPVVRVVLSQPIMKRLFDLCRPHARPSESLEFLQEALGGKEKATRARPR